MPDNEITYKIRGAVYDVYTALGPGLLESVYEEALAFELEQRGLSVVRQKQVPICYKGTVLKTELRLDILVEDQVIVELKSVEELNSLHYKQIRTYLKLTNKPLGWLINFNEDDFAHGMIKVPNRYFNSL